MGTLSRRSRLSPPLTFFLVCLTVSFAGMLVSIPAQPPAKEEKEADPEIKPQGKAPPKAEEEEVEVAKPRRNKVLRVDREEAPGAKGPVVAGPQVGDLLTASKEAKNPAVRDLYFRLARPHDILVANRTTYHRIFPLQEHLGNPPKFPPKLSVLQYEEKEWKLLEKAWLAPRDQLTGINYYEEIAVNRVRDFLNQPLDKEGIKEELRLSRLEMLRVAETALAAAYRYHQSFVATNKRRGKEFEELGADLRRELIKVTEQQLEALTAADDWDGAVALAQRLAEMTQPEERNRLAVPLAKYLAKVKDKDKDHFLSRLRQVDALFPNSPELLELQKEMRTRAQELFHQGLSIAAKDPELAKKMYSQAETLYPRLQGLQDALLRISKVAPAALRVGVRELPENFAPGMAFSDSELMAVELLFESLVSLRYQEDLGQQFVPELALGRPQLIPLGRQFRLSPDAYWANDNPVTAADVRRTVTLIKRTEDWPGYRPSLAEVMDDVQVGGDPYRVSLMLRQGFLDPLSLMTFKVLPAVPWPGQALTASQAKRFARDPIGSGPFVLVRDKEPPPPGTKPMVKFRANPTYGSRANRRNLPFLREIQFITFDDVKLLDDLKNNRYDVVTDFPAELLADLPTKAAHYQEKERQPNRRVYFLAVNHRRPALRNQDLRRALAHAIDRDKALQAFRGEGEGGKKYHQPLTSPFPAGSWASEPKLKYDVRLAKNRMAAAKNKVPHDVKLTLKYPDHDSQILRAMEAIANQVKEEIGVQLELKPVSAEGLREDVQVKHDYDLAYYWHDYESEAYWLWPLFDPAGSQKGENFLGYDNDDRLQFLFKEAMMHCDFTEVQKRTQLLAEELFLKMPLIPLWQLDRFVVMHRAIEVDGPVDPVLVFQDVARWRRKN